MKSTLEEQQAFIAVVDCGSITAAAERLGITVSGVSRALNRLERKLDTTLMRRTTRRLELTQEGETFLDHCRRILNAVEAAEESVLGHQDQPQGRLRVNAAPSFMQLVIVPLIGEFRRRYPGITLALDTHDRFVDLLEQRVDLAIRIGDLEDSSLHARTLGHSPLRLLASPTYLARRGTPQQVASLADHDLLGFNQLDHLNRWPLRDAHGEPLLITPTLSASSGSTLLNLALVGEGIVCLADYMTLQPRQRGELVEVLAAATERQTQRVSAVYYQQSALTRRARAFMDFLAERLPGSHLET
ncbi:LysR substrate-binding domain-containing protein [Salinicola sp. DM10]|uniref:LysR substrate-binding domain-containing protein n=1 Tax=Salinicola sp. DM10 TaxID=2815721 RepID=UPI001A8DA000|nr:LysR substrate-binding domain-containing protein [Salinicola sp. DM10]MCE3028644.1 LysR substrate-binding domain-containing protein [Salinicola sp. DM10]